MPWYGWVGVGAVGGMAAGFGWLCWYFRDGIGWG